MTMLPAADDAASNEFRLSLWGRRYDAVHVTHGPH